MKHNPILVAPLFILFSLILSCKKEESKDGFLSSKPQITN
jgi:hypothetical protein